MGSSTTSLLKEEINKTQESEHDLAKWKLIVTAALGAAALGVAKDVPTSLWLLLFVPFVCAYIDLYDYQYRLRVLVLAKFIRQQTEDATLSQYERYCLSVRRDNVFELGKRAAIGSSAGASLIACVLYYAETWRGNAPSWKGWRAMWCWSNVWPVMLSAVCFAVGGLLIRYLYRDFQAKEKELCK